LSFRVAGDKYSISPTNPKYPPSQHYKTSLKTPKLPNHQPLIYFNTHLNPNIVSKIKPLQQRPYPFISESILLESLI
jgi:hypothetical protein